jgi:hypothetical protein
MRHQQERVIAECHCGHSPGGSPVASDWAIRDHGSMKQEHGYDAPFC